MQPKIKPLNVSIAPEIFQKIVTGKKRFISTRRNPRKNQYFQTKKPSEIKINSILYQIARIIGTSKEWIVHLGKKL